MKVAILGANSMTGLALIKEFNKYPDYDIIEINHKDIGSITDIKNLDSFLGPIKPDILINCTAYNNVNDCETNYELAYQINSVGPLNLAKLAMKYNFKLIHYSTSYVFDGKKGTPYSETDVPNPVNVYATTKLMGEIFVQNYCDNYSIIRITGPYGINPSRTKGTNFFLSIINKSNTSDTIEMVDDEFINPTYIDEIAANTVTLLNKDLIGVFHMVSEGYCSRYEFTSEVFKLLNIKTKIVPIKSKLNSVKRPLFSVLGNDKLKQYDINHMPHWKDQLKYFLEMEHDSINALMNNKISC